MRQLMPFLILSLVLMMQAGTPTFGAENNDCTTLKGIFKLDAKQEDRVCKVEISRKDLNVTNMGLKLSPEMAELSFGAKFEKAGSKTAVTGEFALLREEVNPVIDALRKGHIEVSALHNHMIGEHPQILFLHFQGTGELEALAKTVKSAIDTTVKK